MEDVYVTVIGGGVCGVLAAQRFGKEGLSYKIIEKGEDYGGVWAYRANDYSHLQVRQLHMQCSITQSTLPRLQHDSYLCFG